MCIYIYIYTHNERLVARRRQRAGTSATVCTLFSGTVLFGNRLDIKVTHIIYGVCLFWAMPRHVVARADPVL